jgi:hypothetical protein
MAPPVQRMAIGDRRFFKTEARTFHLPWLGMLSSLLMAALMLLASTIVVQRREF